MDAVEGNDNRAAVVAEAITKSISSGLDLVRCINCFTLYGP